MIHEIAIIEKNTLTAIGLQTILEELIPDTVIRVFSSFEQLIDDTPDMYAHYFVSISIFFEHTSFFLERRPKTIVLSAGEPQIQPGVPYLNTFLPQEKLIKAFMNMRSKGHEKSGYSSKKNDYETSLSAREIEVLVLVTKGLINKEIADKLNISLTTVISHRKNITEKLGIKSVSGLAIYAVMNGYIEADSI